MKILLVGINAKFVHTNLAIKYIKAYCRRFDISLKEYTVNDSIHNVMSDILSLNPDIVGFSCYIWNIEFILKLCSNIKKVKNNIKIILGGPEVSFDAKELMANNTYVDYIVKGEGEISSDMLFHYLSGGSQELECINGLVYRAGENILENGPSDLLERLDDIPFPYSEDDDFRNKIVYYESSRGCPYNCTYCLSSTLKGVRFFSVDRVKKDLLWFINKGVRLVKFVDRTFNCGRHSLEIMNFLVEKRSLTRFHFEISAEILSDELIDFLTTVPVGLFQYEIGVQSTNNKTLVHVNRNVDLKKLFDNIRKLRQSNNAHIHLDLIAGLPGEDYISFSKSFSDVIALKPHMLQIGFLKLLKGSKVRLDAEKYGMAYAGYPPYEVLKTKWLSFDELCELRNIEEFVDRYYNSGRFEASMKYMLGTSSNPFELFKDIMCFEKYKNNQGNKKSNTDQYKILFDYCRSEKIYDMDVLKEFLAFDYLLQGRNPVIPDFLSCDNTMKKEFLWDFLSNKQNINKYLPHYGSLDVKNIVKKIYARPFEVDIAAFIKEDKFYKKNNIVFFDYGHKSESGQLYYFCV